MRIKLQLVMCNDQGDEETVTDIITLNKNHQRIEHLGLPLAESKQLLSTLQRHLLQQQINTFLDLGATCRDCGTPLKLKAHASRSFRILFGTFQFDSPRLEHCDCTRRKTSSFRPLAALLTESVAPELLYMEAKWSSLVSYGMSLDALQDFLPLDLSLDVKTVRYDTLKVAKRLEAELGDEQSSFIEGDASDWDLLRLPEVLHAQGLQMNQEITFLSDGNDTLRALQLEMSPKATHILDWFHLTMKLTVLEQYGKGLVQCEAALGEAIREKIARLKWSLWHGQVDKALGKLADLASAIEPFNTTYTRFNSLVKAL